MMKKVVFAIVVLGLFGGGFFYWWNSQADVRELNKTLPDGVRVTKSLFGNEYKVINKIDGYEFKVPQEWRGVNEIAYIPEREEMGYTGTSIAISGNNELGISLGVDKFLSGGNMEESLGSWAKKEFDAFELVGDFIEGVVGNIDIIKTQENVHFGGEYVYFFKNNKVIYSITGPSEEFIRYIITNGKW